MNRHRRQTTASNPVLTRLLHGLMHATPARIAQTAAGRTATLFLAFTGLLTNLTSSQGRVVTTPLADEIPTLAEHSSWRLDWTESSSSRAAFSVGNGRIAGFFDDAGAASTLRGIVGPDYSWFAISDAASDQTIRLAADGAALTFAEHAIRRVSGANFVVTEDRNPSGLALRTLSFAPPGGAGIVRVIEVENGGPGPVTGLDLQVAMANSETTEASLVRTSSAGDRTSRTTVRLHGGSARDGQLQAAIGDLAAGATWSTVVRIQTASTDAIVAPTELEEAIADARRTQSWWQRKLATTTSYDTDHIKLRDLIRDWSVEILTLRCATTGAVFNLADRSPPSVRDASGALLALLRFKLWDEARDLLRFHHSAAKQLGEIPEQLPWTLAPTDRADPSPTDWSRVAVPGGDTAAWHVLQHLWYWRATQDTALIQAHHDFLLRCVRGQPRGDDDLISFSGHENFLRPLAQMAAGDSAADLTELPGVDAQINRLGYSLASSTLFLTAVQAMGELENAIDRVEHPEKYLPSDAEPKRPGDAWTKRVFTLLRGVEARYWLKEDGFFAPAISAVDLEPIRVPIANANLMPLWAGWTYPTGEKSRDNLRNSLAQLWRSGARIGTTPTLGWSTGELQGMLLTALSERDGLQRKDVIDTLLEQAEPAGHWAPFYASSGERIGGRSSVGASGINLDAILFAVTGIRHANVPNWDNKDIRLKLRVPHGASYFSVKNTAKDGRRLNVFFRQTESKLTEAERAANDELKAEKRRDPAVPHRRLRFVVDMLEGRPESTVYDVGLNAEGTMFLRYLGPTPPATEEEHDFRRIEEMEFATSDTLQFLPTGPSKTWVRPGRVVAKAGEGAQLVLSCRPQVRQLLDVASTTFFDTGIAFRVEDIERQLLDMNGELVHDRLLLDWSWNAAPPTSFVATAIEASAQWKDLLIRFQAAGGTVVRPTFVDRATLTTGTQPTTLEVNANGGLEVPAADQPRSFAIACSIADATAPRELVLSVGVNAPMEARWNGEPLFQLARRSAAVPDQSAWLVTVRPGANRLECTLPAGDTATVYARFVDSSGLPVSVSTQ